MSKGQESPVQTVDVPANGESVPSHVLKEQLAQERQQRTQQVSQEIDAALKRHNANLIVAAVSPSGVALPAKDLFHNGWRLIVQAQARVD